MSWGSILVCKQRWDPIHHHCNIFMGTVMAHFTCQMFTKIIAYIVSAILYHGWASCNPSFATVSDDKFSTHLPPGMYQKPKQIFYPDAHPDLQQFHPKVAANAQSDSAASEVDALSTALGVYKAPPMTMSAETTHVIKSMKVSTGGTHGHTHASDFDELTKAVLEDTITMYKGKLFTHGAFLDRSKEYDLAVESFVFVCKTRKIQMEIEDDLMKLVCDAVVLCASAISMCLVRSHSAPLKHRVSVNLKHTHWLRQCLVSTLSGHSVRCGIRLRTCLIEWTSCTRWAEVSNQYSCQQFIFI